MVQPHAQESWLDASSKNKPEISTGRHKLRQRARDVPIAGVKTRTGRASWRTQD